MNGKLVADIKVKNRDFNDNEIEVLYGSVSELYAVYRAADHVYIHYADDKAQGANQRAALTPLSILRSEVDAGIDRIRAREYLLRSDKAKEILQARAKRKATELEWRLARILLMALQGDAHSALAQLTALRDEMNEERASEIRSWHLFYASLATLVTIALCWMFSSAWFKYWVHDFEDYAPRYWNAAAIGAIGALFSIALQLRARAVPVDLQKWDNICDAVLRIFIGATSAVILHALFFGGLVSLQIGSEAMKLGDCHGADLARQLVLAFTAGFAERLVADFVGGLALAAVRPAPPSIPPAASSARNEIDVARGTAEKAPPDPTPRQAPRDVPHDPNVPNRIEADDIADAATLIGGKLDPMEDKV